MAKPFFIEPLSKLAKIRMVSELLYEWGHRKMGDVLWEK